MNSSSGTKLYIGPVTAAADAAAYAALTWVEVSEVESIPEFGETNALVSFVSMSAGRVRKAKGAADSGDLTVACANLPRDAGQLAMIAARATKFAYAIKIVVEDSPDANDGDSTFYFHAYVMAAKPNIGGANDPTKRNFGLAIETAIFEVPSANVA